MPDIRHLAKKQIRPNPNMYVNVYVLFVVREVEVRVYPDHPMEMKEGEDLVIQCRDEGPKRFEVKQHILHT